MSEAIRKSHGGPLHALMLGLGLVTQISCDPDVSNLSAGGALGGSSSAVSGASGAVSMSGQAPTELGGAGTGGTGSAGAGTAGQINAGGSGGTSGGEAGRTDLLLFSDGRVVPGSNGYGIDGEWRSFGADVDLITTDFSGDRICAKGKVLGVANGNYGRYWGGGVQLALRAAGAPYDATAHGLAGISFVLEGKDVPIQLRLKFKESSNTDNYCKNIEPVPGSSFDLTTAAAVHNCWMSGGAAVDATALESFDLHIVPESPSDISFDFCVTQVTVLPG